MKSRRSPHQIRYSYWNELCTPAQAGEKTTSPA